MTGEELPAVLELLEAVTHRVQDVEAALEGLTKEVAAAEGALEPPAERPDAAQAAGGGKPAQPGPYVWTGLDTETAADLLDTLADFVDRLNARYQLDRRSGVTPCWPLHGGVVEEVTALYAAYLDAYHRPDRLTATPANWHARVLPGFLTRLRGQGGPLSGCDDGHRGTTAAVPPTDRTWRADP